MGNPTITDVARRAGVSTATVSRHLRGSQVRHAIAIARAIEELSYIPNRAARSLKSGATLAIGVVVPDITNPFFAAVVKGIESVTRDSGYSVFLCNTEESADRERRVLAELWGKVDGLILTPVTETAEHHAELRRTGVPIVFLDSEPRGVGSFDSVLIDNEGGGRQAAEYLLELGHRRIAIISGPLDTTPGRGRYEGFTGALQAAGLELATEWVHIGDFREESARQATLRLLALSQPPTAIFAANNLMSIGTLRALHDLGVRVPDEISFIGFDDLELGELLAPPLTSVSRPMVEQGVIAMRLLRNRLEGHAAQTKRIVLETSLTIRGSCAEPPAERSRWERA
jgi:LacI family transcriptional regulator